MNVQSIPLFFIVTLSVKSRVVTVKGKRGTLVKSFKHMALELTKVGKNKLRVDIWFANRKQLACLKTTVGHINNMFKGVTYVSMMFSLPLKIMYLFWFTI